VTSLVSPLPLREREGPAKQGEGYLLRKARNMRREPTPPERTLWRVLRNFTVDGLKFRRQAPLGPYIVDFFCAEARLIVELDGITHVDEPRDAIRDAWLKARGYTVLRFWNNEVMANLDGVLEVIRALARTPHPNPLPQGEREQAISPSPLEGEGRGEG